MAVAVEHSRAWLATGTGLFLECLRRLTDGELAAPTSLPGWTRRHLIAHVGYNAEALRRLVRWASTGARTPMYSSARQRSAEIERGAALPPTRLRRFATETARLLDDDLDRLPADRWHVEVTTAQGRLIPATQIPWLRVREVAVHAVDLAVGVDFEDLPAQLCVALVDDVVAWRSTRAPKEQ